MLNYGTSSQYLQYNNKKPFEERPAVCRLDRDQQTQDNQARRSPFVAECRGRRRFSQSTRREWCRTRRRRWFGRTTGRWDIRGSSSRAIRRCPDVLFHCKEKIWGKITMIVEKNRFLNEMFPSKLSNVTEIPIILSAQWLNGATRIKIWGSSPFSWNLSCQSEVSDHGVKLTIIGSPHKNVLQKNRQSNLDQRWDQPISTHFTG